MLEGYGIFMVGENLREPVAMFRFEIDAVVYAKEHYDRSEYKIFFIQTKSDLITQTATEVA